MQYRDATMIRCDRERETLYYDGPVSYFDPSAVTTQDDARTFPPRMAEYIVAAWRSQGEDVSTLCVEDVYEPVGA